MAKDIFDTILEKEFSQLTSRELAEMAEFCKTEEEFLAMKQVLAHSKTIAEGPKLSPKEATKEKLDNLFHSTYGKERRIIPFYLNPIIQIAAIIVVGFAVWMFMLNSNTPEKTQMAENTIPKEAEKIKEEPIIQQEAAKDSGNLQQKNEWETIKTPSSRPCTTAPEAIVHELPSHGLYKSNVMDENVVIFYGNSGREPAEYEIFDPVSRDFVTIVGGQNKKEVQQVEDTDNLSHIQDAKTYKSVSAPASSVKDISVDVSKSPYKNQIATSMNVSEQKNVMNYLVTKY